MTEGHFRFPTESTARRITWQHLTMAVLPVSVVGQQSTLNSPPPECYAISRSHQHCRSISPRCKGFQPERYASSRPQTPPIHPWATWLFGHGQETVNEPSDKATVIARPHLNNLWPHLSTVLSGREEPALYSVVTCDVQDWNRVNDSHLFWTALVAFIDHPNTRVVVLKASGTSVQGGIQFTQRAGRLERGHV